MGDLALQVGRVDMVAVGNDDPADARCGEVQRRRRAEAAGADDQDGGFEQALLRLDADLVEQNVPAIAQELLVVHRGRRGVPRPTRCWPASVRLPCRWPPWRP